MKIVISHFGGISQLLPVNGLVSGIKNQEVNTDITVVVEKEEYCYIFKYNKNIRRTITLEKFIKENGFYDLLINLDPFFPENLHVNSEIKMSTGFCFCSDYDKFKKVVVGEDKFSEMSILQLYFILSGLTWRGEGYNIGYRPKTKSNKKRVGVCVANANVRNYVLDNLNIDDKKVWYIPYKKNIFKKMEEINKCKKIITDDLIIFHLAVSMKKYVYYLETFQLSMRLEFFNKGEVYKVPMTIF